MDIPEDLAAITPEWLGAALQDVAPGARTAKVAKVEVVDAHSGTTGRARLAVTWESGDLPAPLAAAGGGIG